MPQERLTMRKIREILRLRWGLQLSERVVARSCRISHSTVGDYVKRAERAGLQWPLPEELSEKPTFRTPGIKKSVFSKKLTMSQ
jgi:transposase